MGVSIIRLFESKYFNLKEYIFLNLIFEFKLCMLADQLMCIKFVLWRKSIFSSTKAILSSLALLLFLFILNFHLIFTIKYNNDSENKTLIEHLISSKMLAVWTMHVNI